MNKVILSPLPSLPNSPLIAHLSHAIHFRNAITSLSLTLCFQAYIIASHALWASQILTFRALFAAKIAAFHGLVVSSRAAYGAWDTKAVRALRKKLFYELAVFVLGSGNGVFLIVFWPGWLVLGGTSWALWQFWG